MKWIFLFVYSTFLLSCDHKSNKRSIENSQEASFVIKDDTLNLFYEAGEILSERINCPENYTRKEVAPNSFANYLRNLPLKPHGAEVKYYNGTTKANQSIYDAVVDLPIGNKDLHQCADAIMRLYAEYLWKAGKPKDIHFNFTNGFQVEYTKWMEGDQMIVSGNKTFWKSGSPRENSYENFWKFMELIFTYAGTASLEKELKAIDLELMQIGDIFIKGGHPGHAIIVLDMAENSNGEQLFLLGQSYMPAQEIQLLKNNQDAEISPWYKLVDFEVLNTPEWSFTADQLKRFTK